MKYLLASVLTRIVVEAEPTVLISSYLQGRCPLACDPSNLVHLSSIAECQDAIFDGWEHRCDGTIDFTVDGINVGFGVECRSRQPDLTYYILYIPALRDAIGIMATDVSGTLDFPSTCSLRLGVRDDDASTPPTPENLCGMQNSLGKQEYVYNVGSRVSIPSGMIGVKYLVAEGDSCDDLIYNTRIHVRAIGQYEVMGYDDTTASPSDTSTRTKQLDLEANDNIIYESLSDLQSSGPF
eukprot:Blabericola_migrator_1__2028@NODE_1552_length_4299_cov_243_952032_g1017_i0_p2_GENE_NODE_1552_length_4299_cov_243_952032_g1017_i0NODE_1552_length_4299_cov_243_952032_g1017_i0_p2_ORF_typecomplete_len238_score30_64_NODE_1552_length_4299_cov_243_952032_g1017_i07381451